MSELNNATGLSKTFTLKMGIIIVMSAIIGSGVFKKVAPMAELLHAPWLVILAWLLAGIIILFGVFSIAELGAMFPHSGGPFRWLDEVYGEKLSFLYGWSCFTVVQTAAISSIAFVFAGALDTFVPLPELPDAWRQMRPMGLPLFANFGAKLVACLIIIALTALNIKGARNSGKLSLVFTFLITTSIALICCAAFASKEGALQNLDTVSSAYPAEGFGIWALVVAMVLAIRSAFWGYEGWIALGFIGEEIENPQKNLPRALTIGIVSIILMYLVVHVAYLYVMPVDELLTTVNADENSIAAVVVMNRILGEGGAYVVSAMILISTFGCTNATILVSSRIYYAMAQKGLFFRKAATTHQRFRTPHYALLYQGIWACILVFSGSFELLTDLVIIAAFVFNGLIVWGVVWLRWKRPDITRTFKTPGYPVVPVVFVLFSIVLLVVSFIESPVKSLIGLGFIFSGLPFYYYWKRKRRSLA